jgi:acyl carrier protein
MSSVEQAEKSAVKSSPTETEICDWCVAYLAKTVKGLPKRIDPRAKFARLGMDSAASVLLVADLEDWLGVELGTEIVFEHQTPAALARYLAAHCAAQSSASTRNN